MNIDTTITERDKKLLVFLGAFLIFICFFWFLIKPTINDIIDLNGQVTGAELKQSQITNGINKIPELKQTIAETKAEFEKASKPYFNNLQEQDVDNFLTELALNHGFSQSSLKELKIVFPTEYFTRTTYLQELQAEEAAASPTEATNESINTESGGEGAADTETQAEAPADNTLLGIYGVEVSFKLYGTRDKVQPFLNKLVNDYKGIQVTSFTWQQVNADNSSLFVLTVNMNFYTTEVKIK